MRIDRSELETGDTVVFGWNPYEWYAEQTGVSGYMTAEITDVCDISGDIVMELTETGETVRDYGEGRRYVSGRSDWMDDMPDRTDVGMGGQYYQFADN